MEMRATGLVGSGKFRTVSSDRKVAHRRESPWLVWTEALPRPSVVGLGTGDRSMNKVVGPAARDPDLDTRVPTQGTEP